MRGYSSIARGKRRMALVVLMVGAIGASFLGRWRISVFALATNELGQNTMLP
jgi:DNA-binding transcriptional regulator of glucitol operon